MKVKWNSEAVRDLDRLRRFLTAVNPRAANQAVASLRHTPKRLLDHPRLGIRLEEFEHREVRRIVVGNYELRYEIAGEIIFILHIWHGREDR